MFFFSEAPDSRCFQLIYFRTDTSKTKTMVIQEKIHDLWEMRDIWDFLQALFFSCWRREGQEEKGIRRLKARPFPSCEFIITAN